SRRALEPTYLIAVALWREGKPGEAALANDDVRRVQAMLLDGLKRLTDSGTEWDWAMLRAAHPDVAAGLVGQIQAREVQRRLAGRRTAADAGQAGRARSAVGTDRH